MNNFDEFIVNYLPITMVILHVIALIIGMRYLLVIY